MMFCALVASGQIRTREVNGRNNLA